MNKEIELLLIEKDKLMDRIKHIKTEIELIDIRILEIRKLCPHKNLEIIEVKGNDYNYVAEKCKDCRESWLF